FGPHIGIAVVREGLFESLTPYKLQPAPDFIPDKLETGTQNHEGLAGIAPAIDFIASLGEGETRRERLVDAFAHIHAYESLLADKMREGLATLPGIRLFQAPPEVAKTPTIAFQLDGFTPLEVCQYLAEEHSIFVAEGHFYASTLAAVLGITESGGWVRAGLAPYNSLEEVDRFLNGLQHLLLHK
ncbi:MAG TPA: aminotransferase class V-fold PLP-dependent enzyme, partial [Bacilli bacterium]|nr:aminotransferase class V-fold PLP-dependent enzyme [Bacilli bacterium]